MRRREFVRFLGGAGCRNESQSYVGTLVRNASSNRTNKKSQGNTQAARTTTATATTTAATTATAARRGDYVWSQS